MPYKNPEDAKARSKKYREKHRTEILERNRKYYKSNKLEFNEKAKAYEASHKKERLDYYHSRKDKARSKYLQRSFGITLEQYNVLLEMQHGVCAICLEPETATSNGKLKALAVDHDHSTNKIRGLLCANCNRALGGFKDNVERLRRAAEYLLS